MGYGKCPGRTAPRNLDSVTVTCPGCGRSVEFFTDEPKRQCRCGRILWREAMPRCADWCPAADRCLGEVVDARQTERRRRGNKTGPQGQVDLESVRKRLKRK